MTTTYQTAAKLTERAFNLHLVRVRGGAHTGDLSDDGVLVALVYVMGRLLRGTPLPRHAFKTSTEETQYNT